MTELVVATPEVLPDVLTGEVLPATIENVPRILAAARAMKSRCDDLIRAATSIAVEESRTRGTKTLHLDGATVKLSGGSAVEYDPEALAELLREADCPEDRINACVVATVTYKVDLAVLRQLTGANPDYAAAADLAKSTVPKSWSASVDTK